MSDAARITTLRTGIKMVIERLEPSLLTDTQKVILSKQSLQILLDSDLDKSLERNES